MTPPTVLLDISFLQALIAADVEAEPNPDAERHDEASQCYARLVDAYVPNSIRIRARADHLQLVDRTSNRDLLAPVEAIQVAHQFRRQAGRLHGEYTPDLAITLVVMRRESISRIATFDPFFDTIDVIVER